MNQIMSQKDMSIALSEAAAPGRRQHDGIALSCDVVQPWLRGVPIPSHAAGDFTAKTVVWSIASRK
ncbi:hypothetical protein [Nocardia sp. NPDC050710]|uniref:hypothetical protein n=1 Tax=Nocardia sp. NPDC050710 TaxID=3157220 RepID=UPI0033E4845E